MSQELRYNLATKVMRNGVEVIVATDRNMRPVEPEYLRHLSSTVTRPITLAPHTLTNLMSMVLPTDHADDGQNHLMSILKPSFTTRTYYTTYNYPATVKPNNKTSVSHFETVVTNIRTEEHHETKTLEDEIRPTATVTLNSSPSFRTETFHTAFTYWNTILDGEQPIVVSSTWSLSNTQVGLFGMNNELEPSETFPATNTYLKTIEFTKMLTDGTDFQMISTKDLVTQVVVTDKPIRKSADVPVTTDVTKTYFVTYTYFSTYVDGDRTKVKSDVSVSSDVTIEKFYIKPKKTDTKIVEESRKPEVADHHSTFPFSILATKAYQTTFTYFTTLFQGPSTDEAETKINSRIKVVENTVTQTLALDDFNPDYLLRLNSSLNKVTGAIVATATLKKGEKIKITAHRTPPLSDSYLKYEIKPTSAIQIADDKTQTHHLEKKEEEPVKVKSTNSKSSLLLSKTKSSVLQKTKTKPSKTVLEEATAEALIGIEKEGDSVPVTPTVTLTPAFATRTPAESSMSHSTMVLAQESLPPEEVSTSFQGVKDKTEEFSESDSATKKPVLRQPSASVNVSNLLNLNSLGINGMNVLGPVFNAMAELIHNNLNKNVDSLTRRNDTSSGKDPDQSLKKPTATNTNPLLSFVSKFTPSAVKGSSEPKVKDTTPRTPVYIPVGSFAKDSEFEESQNSEVVANKPENWHEKWTDIHAKNFEKGRPHDSPITILEGGIPISPGQVITTNSDVIIGRPGETGPRPPSFAVKNNIPIDMKPPPLPSHVVFSGLEEDGFLGQHSTNQGMDFNVEQDGHPPTVSISPSRPSIPPPKKQVLEHSKLRPHVSDRFKGPHHKNPGKHTHVDYDSGTMDLNPPPVPPPPVRSHDVHRPITINHEQKDDSETHQTPNHVLSIPLHLGPAQNVENYINPAELGPPVLGVPSLPVLGQIHQENVGHILSEPTPNINVNPNGILLIPTVAHIPLNLIPTGSATLVDRSTGHQLLVNIQPSQVANIVIPHGSSTALILSDGKQHSLKGEVIDDPSPHPEPETVGFVGAEPVLKIESDDLSAAVHNDVIPAEAAEIAQQSSNDREVAFSNRPHLTTELIKIRPKPVPSAKGQDPYNLHSASQQNSHHLLLDQQQSNYPPPNNPELHQDFSHPENHRPVENIHKNLLLNQNSYFLNQKGSLKTDSIQNQDNQGTNHASEAAKIHQNYRKEGPNVNNLSTSFLSQIKQNASPDVHLPLGQHNHHNYLVNTGGLLADQKKFIQNTKPIRGETGIYVDISPPGHLPPRPNANVLHQSSYSSNKHQSVVNEHLLNHQSGLVHDVPLNAQVQLGTGQKKENPLKEILISANTNKHDNIYDPKKKPVEGKFSEGQSPLKRPLPELPENLSPPPVSKEGSYRIHRPSPFKPPHPMTSVQRFSPYPHQLVPKPVDFMMPPPQVAHRPNQKPHPDHHPRPLIPIGAGAQQNYANPRPEDILIVPHKNRPPGIPTLNYVNNINHEVHRQTIGPSSDLDVSDTNEPIKTEYGEEIQESVSRPLFPGQLPIELQEFNASHLHNHKLVEFTKDKPNLEIQVKPKLEPQKENAGGLTKTPTQWSPDQHYKHEAEHTPSPASHGSFFSLIRKPSGFVSTNHADLTNHKQPGFANHKESSFANHKEQTSSDVQRIASGTKGSGTTSGSLSGDKIRIHAAGPSFLPSGFVKNKNAADHKRPNESVHESSASSSTNNNKVKVSTKETTGPSHKPSSNDTLKKLEPEQKFSNLVPLEPPKTPFGQIKGEASGTNQKFGQSAPGQKVKPVQEPENGIGEIKFDSSKISAGYPSVASSGIYNSGTNKPQRYPIADSTSPVKTNKRPSGFTTPKKEEKIPGGFGSGENIPPGVPQDKLPTKPTNNAVHSGGPGKVPSGFATKNESDVSSPPTANHNYSNKTVHFFESKPGPAINEERDAVYNKPEDNVDLWFASNFGGSSELQNPTSVLRNATSASTSDSNVHITLLPPPRVGDGRPKPEDVMGLSPPPLERPRRPQTSHRPKPPFKYEIPTTPKSTLPPIAIENDFPPVRSPEFNRKPIKPQDIFPPRLPDNFIHHLPEYPIRNRPKPRPHDRPVTSMPIDIPGSGSSTEKTTEESSGRDTFFAGSEINGHSKPIIEAEPNFSSLRPPPPPPPPQNNRVKPKPSSVYQQPPKIRTSEKIKSEAPHSTEKLPTATEREEISPTATLKPGVQTTFHTKVSTSVTPTAVQPQNNWPYADIITGSETVFDPDKFSNYVTPSINDFTSKKNLVTTLISTGSTTIFGDLYTSTTKTDSAKSSSNSTVFGREHATEKPFVTPTKSIPAYTTTLTVTTTMTTVVHSIGHKPSTKTIVLTKTLISTVVNKVTETKTLVKPTTATVIQTHTVATTKTALVVPTALYPTQTKYPGGGTLKPEIFMADPHAKDTMTISVSSSMNKNKPGEEKRKQGGGMRAEQSGKDSILVLMSNKHPTANAGGDENIDVISDEENDINDSRVMVGGVFDANNEEYQEKNKEVECSPGCKAKRNELCQRIEGVMKCVCRPGFARMFPDRPCRPTYTYNVQLVLEKFGSEEITHEKNFAQPASPNMAKLASVTKEGLDRMIMQSDLRDVYHGIMVNGFQGKEKKTMVDFYVQLSENTDEAKLMEILKKTLRTSNYSLGGTELFAAREPDSLFAEDFNECLNFKFHDCSENARCFNLKGTYTCSCKEGFTDLSENSQFPGRLCSDTIGCEYCGYHGACYSKGEGQITCECFQWYSGERCHINLKVLLIALVTIGAVLLALLLVCAVMTCLNKRSRSSTASRTNGSGYLRYRGPSNQSLDRRAMIADSSSESSVDNLPYICSPTLQTDGMNGKKKPVLRHVKGPVPRPAPPAGMEQRDRSVTVMIPRAKYRPMPPLSPHLTMSTFSPDKHLSKTAAQIAAEQKLMNYLDGNGREDRTLASGIQNGRQVKEQQKSGEYKNLSATAGGSPKPAEKKKEAKVFEYEYKISNMLFTEETNSTDKRSFKSLDDRFRRHSDSTHLNTDVSNRNQFRKYSAGALVSAGYEVSAKVGMHHLEEDTTEDEHSAIVNTHTMKSTRSQFTTLNRTGDHKTMSEARSYDETTVHPPTRSLKTHYSGSSPSSRVNNDEGHTMIERDLGSTFIMPESQLFKPDADRGSDISNFDSL